jgi:hypothetical protein
LNEGKDFPLEEEGTNEILPHRFFKLDR